MSETLDTVFSKSVLARALKIQNRFDAKQRLKQGAIFGLGLIGLGLGVAFIEPAPLDEPVLTVTAENNENIITISVGDRLGSLAVVGGLGLAATAGYGLILIRKEEAQLAAQASPAE